MAKLSEKALLARDAKRDIGAELLESVRQMKREDLHVVYVPAKAAREKTGLSQAQFATCFRANPSRLGARPHPAVRCGPHAAGHRIALTAGAARGRGIASSAATSAGPTSAPRATSGTRRRTQRWRCWGRSSASSYTARWQSS